MRRQAVFDHAILIVGTIVMCGPLLAVFLATTHDAPSFRETGLTLVPGGHGLSNYGHLLQSEGGFRGDITALGMIWNSFLLGAGFALAKVSLSLLAAYSLVYFRLRFAAFFFWLLLLSLMLPLESRFLPTYDVVSSLGLVNTQAGLILPLATSGIGTFFFRQFLQNIPDSMLESARLDGAGPLKFLRDILIPLSMPMAGALFLVTFVNGWNQYLWPVMVTSEEARYTIVRGLQFYGRSSLTGMMLACLAVLPPALLLVFFQRLFVKGLFDGSH